MLEENKVRFIVNLDDLRQNLGDNCIQELKKEPAKVLQTMKTKLTSLIEDFFDQGGKKNKGSVTEKESYYSIAFTGNLGGNLVTPRGLGASKINQLVAVQGICTRVSSIKEKLLRSVHYCEATKLGSVREYVDEFEIKTDRNLNWTNNYPLKDQQGNPLQNEYGYHLYKDQQIILLQEMPEKTPTGQLPRSIEVIMQDDLVDLIKPGDRCQIYGVFKPIASANSAMTGTMRYMLVCINVEILQNIMEQQQITAKEVQEIENLSKMPNIFEIISDSVAPAIQGYQYIKKAIALMLLGGVEKVTENKTHLRGDINILLIGDPSTAKSQFLRRVLTLAPLSINTTGQGSSGVGLTAAVVYDKDTGDRHLEAGAMVLADKGIVCIDEFDKMNEVDRVAIHEVMEQQTVTIAKAGIHSSLNARCSVLAAANPIYGTYIQDFPPSKNIGLPDSLLSRFDLLFVVLDKKDSKIDRLISERVTKNHQYRAPWEEQGQVLQENIGNIEPEHYEKEQQQVYEQHNKQFHDDKKIYLTISFLKKYLYYAKKRVVPLLDEEAMKQIGIYFKDLRRIDKQNREDHISTNQPITIRSLETLQRLAQAHAKLRLSQTVSKDDVDKAYELMNYSLFGDNDVDMWENEEQNKLREDLNQEYRPAGKDQKIEPLSNIVHMTRKKKKDIDQQQKEQKSDTDASTFIDKQIVVTEGQKARVYQAIVDIQELEGIQYQKLVDLLVGKGGRDAINSLNELDACLHQLSDNNAIVYDKVSQLIFNLSAM